MKLTYYVYYYASFLLVFTYLHLCLQMSYVYFSSADHVVITSGSHLTKYYGR